MLEKANWSNPWGPKKLTVLTYALGPGPVTDKHSAADYSVSQRDSFDIFAGKAPRRERSEPKEHSDVREGEQSSCTAPYGHLGTEEVICVHDPVSLVRGTHP